MSLVWKLLRQHISVPQFIGFFFANLFGMIIVLLAFQFYRDVLPVFTADDSFMKADYLIMSKKIGTASTISGRTNTFNNSDIIAECVNTSSDSILIIEKILKFSPDNSLCFSKESTSCLT